MRLELTRRDTLPVTDPNWKWLGHDGVLRKPCDMHTGHLFNTLKMVWNNRMPRECRVGDVRLYYFPNHPDEYLKQAIYELAWELGKRELSAYQIGILDLMAHMLEVKPELLQELKK